METNARPLVIYHGNCADGFTAAWCFWRRYGLGADFHPGTHGAAPPDVTGREVYIVDFSYRYEVLIEMASSARGIVILDHHKTAAEALGRLPPFKTGAHGAMSVESAFAECAMSNIPAIAVCFDMQRSGATLAWDFLFPATPRPHVLRHVEDRDLWRFALPFTREIQAFVFSHEYTFEKWDELMAVDAEQMQVMITAGQAIERKHHKDIAELVKVCQRTMIIAGHEVPVASLPYTVSSDAGHLMAAGQSFAACYWDTPDHRVFSLRSQDDGADVAVIAETYGGGGHARAAGFRVGRDHLLAQA